MRKDTWLASMLLIAFFISSGACARAAEVKKTSYQEVKSKALSWLVNQMVPNSRVPEPEPDRRHLVLSYEIPPELPAYPYIYGRSAIYDDALAVVAFTMVKDYQNAAFILNALKRLTHSDGGLWFSYNTNNSWPNADDHDGALYRAGAIAWVGYAAVYYLQKREMETAGIIAKDKEAGAFLKMAETIADYLIRLQVNDKGLRFGLVTGGENAYLLELKEKNITEVFQVGNIDWISSEHNIDCYFFLRDLGRLTANERYVKAAQVIKDNLLKLWSKNDRQYYQGVKINALDTELALDGATWGAVFSNAAGQAGYAKACLETVEAVYRSSDTAGLENNILVKGYKPYASKKIYDNNNEELVQYYFPAHPVFTWKEFQGVWGEGSLGAAMAYLKLGEAAKAKEIIDEVIKLQNSNGGVLYFTKEVPNEFSNFPSVASTAWLVMDLAMLEDEKIKESFWGK